MKFLHSGLEGMRTAQGGTGGPKSRKTRATGMLEMAASRNRRITDWITPNLSEVSLRSVVTPGLDSPGEMTDIPGGPEMLAIEWVSILALEWEGSFKRGRGGQ